MNASKPQGKLFELKVDHSYEKGGEEERSTESKARAINKRSVVSVAGVFVGFNGEQYLKLPNGNMLPEVWTGIYQWFAGGIAPNKQREALNRTAPEKFSEIHQAKDELTQFV